MPNRCVFDYAGTVTASTDVNLDAIDLSRADSLYMEVQLSSAPGAVSGDTCNVYLQSRGRSGVWNDRIAIDQLLGNMSSGEVRDATLLKQATTLATTEKEGEPSGSTGASRLTAGTVRQGAFPGLYRIKGTPGQGAGTFTAWRVDFVVVSSSAPSFPLKIRIWCDTDEG